MSFSEEIKNELCHTECDECCRKAEGFGMLLFGRSFGATGVSLLTGSGEVAAKYADAIYTLTGIKATVVRSDAGKYTINVTKRAEATKIINTFGYSGNEVALRINRSNFENDCCVCAFLRGVFLVCGSVTDPEKDYHLEFVCSKQKLSDDLARIISEIYTQPKRMKRRNGYALYFKDGEGIEDLLGYMGASVSFMKMMNIRASKDMRNKINRQMNFENANLNRTIEANMAQIDAIHTIERFAPVNTLDSELTQLMSLRLDNMEATLAELGELMNPPLSRSAVSRRFKKILLTAEELKRKKI